YPESPTRPVSCVARVARPAKPPGQSTSAATTHHSPRLCCFFRTAAPSAPASTHSPEPRSMRRTEVERRTELERRTEGDGVASAWQDGQDPSVDRKERLPDGIRDAGHAAALRAVPCRDAASAGFRRSVRCAK